MGVQTIVSPSGDELVVLSRQDYQDLLDARDHAAAMREVAAGADTMTDAELREYLAAPTPLAYWRKRRGMTRAQLATELDISYQRPKVPTLHPSWPAKAGHPRL